MHNILPLWVRENSKEFKSCNNLLATRKIEKWCSLRFRLHFDDDQGESYPVLFSAMVEIRLSPCYLRLHFHRRTSYLSTANLILSQPCPAYKLASEGGGSKEERQRMKYAYVSCEILSSKV